MAARVTASFDRPLLFISLALATIGMVTLYSASYETPGRLSAQVFNLGFGLAAMWVVAQIPPQTLMRFAPAIYLGGLVLLIGVALFGEIANGARRWLDLGFARFQPSEVMKIAMPLMLAWYFHRNEGAVRARDFLFAAVLLATPVFLIARQPDLGTAILVGSAGLYVIFFAGISWRILAGLGALALAALPLLWSVMHDYQRRRILTLLDPSQDPLGAGYHTIQSTIAVGSGGVFGKGWLNGTQTHLEFIPERHTDFIFAVFGEEFGLAGAAILILLFMLLIARGFMIASNAPTFFSRLLAAAVTLMFFTYAFVNIGMVCGILPVVGVPLPFMSYGGTALATLFTGIGILMSVHANRKLVQT